jgi:hypothetical protein
MLLFAEYLVALAVGYLIVAVIANRQLGKSLPLPAFVAKRLK